MPDMLLHESNLLLLIVTHFTFGLTLTEILYEIKNTVSLLRKGYFQLLIHLAFSLCQKMQMLSLKFLSGKGELSINYND